MRRKGGPGIAVFVILVAMVASCSPTDAPDTLPVQPTPTSAPATVVPVQPTPTNAPATVAPVQPTPTSAPPTASPIPASPNWPSARKYGAMVYDPLSQRILMFGGVERLYDEVDIPEVWAYDPASNSWQERGELGPDAVVCAAYDEESQRAIVFGWGGTWAYDPAADTWEEMNPEEAPSQRWSSQMAYDAESDRMMLFGGGTGITNLFDDTWVYDYNSDTWTEMQLDSSPPARGYHGMLYVPETDRILLWGGTTKRDVVDLSLWAYDYNANRWTAQAVPADAPEPRAGFGLFYHPPSGRLIAFGGLTEADGKLVEETTWAYDYGANSWERLVLSESPGERAFFPMAYAPAVDKAILFGGELINKTADKVSDETWVFDPATNEWKNAKQP